MFSVLAVALGLPTGAIGGLAAGFFCCFFWPVVLALYGIVGILALLALAIKMICGRKKEK